MKILFLILFPFLCFGQLSLPGALHASGDTGPNEFITVRIPNASITANHTDFIAYLPLALIETAAGNFFSGLSADGSDLRVYESNHTTELNWDTFDVDFTSETGMLIIHLNLTDGTNNDFIVDWAGTRTAKGVAFHEATWVNFKFAWHFNSYTGAGSIKNRNGVTANDLTPTNMASGALQTGSPMGKYLAFDGSNDYLTAADDASQDISYPMTFYTWMVIPSSPWTGNNAWIINKYTTSNLNKQYGWDMFSNTNLARHVTYFNNAGSAAILSSSTGIYSNHNDNGWHLYTLTHGAAVGGNKSFYMDAASYGTVTTTTGTHNTGSATINISRILSSTPSYSNLTLAGMYWENIERSSAWVTDFYLMGSSPATFFTLIY